MKPSRPSLGIVTAFRKLQSGRIFIWIFVPALSMAFALVIMVLKANGTLAQFTASDGTPPHIPDAIVAPLANYRYTPETECIADIDKPGGFILETGAFIPYSGTSDPVQDTAWQARTGVDVINANAPGVPSQPASPLTAAFAGASTLEIKEGDWGKPPLEFMRDFLTANPAKGGLSPVANVQQGAVLETILASSALPVPVKGKVSILSTNATDQMMFIMVSARPPRSYWLVRTLDGRVGLLQTIDIFTGGKQHQLAIRWKLLEQSPAPEPNAPAAPAEFRGLSWLDEIRSTPKWHVWSPQGVLLDRTEWQLPDWLPAPSKQDLAKVDADSLYACFWFFCPGADSLSYADVRVLNASSKPQNPGDPANALNITSARMQDKDSGWIISTQYVGRRGAMPPWAIIQLSYSSGPWQPWRDLPPGFSGKMPIENGDHVTRTGQTSDGKAFVELTRTLAEENAGDSNYRTAKIGEQIDFVAKSKEGHILTRAAIASTPGADGTTIDRYLFDVPLDHVSSFEGRTRPIWNLTIRPGFGRSLAPYDQWPRDSDPAGSDAAQAAEFGGAAWADKATGFDWRLAIFDSDLSHTALLQPMLLLPPSRQDLVKAAAGGAQPIYLDLWFFQPEFDAQSLVDVALLDDSDHPLGAPQEAQSALNASAISPRQGESGGWIMARFYEGRVDKQPGWVRARLRYSVGAWQQGADIAPDLSGPVPLETGSRVTKVDRDNYGRAYIQVTRDKAVDSGDTQFDFVAVTSDGTIIPRSSVSESRSPDGPIVQSFFFDTPLNGVKTFQVRQRPIQTAVFRHFIPPRQ